MVVLVVEVLEIMVVVVLGQANQGYAGGMVLPMVLQVVVVELLVVRCYLLVHQMVMAEMVEHLQDSSITGANVGEVSGSDVYYAGGGGGGAISRL